ncbi:MAG: RIP metalloprotease RseP [Hylemonella sp.]
MLTILAFLAALTLLIAVHEYGHYRMARWCGVSVLRFSIGFGKVLWRWQPRGAVTEFTLCALPLGGYVRMLDEREAPVPPEQRHQAFNVQPLSKRALIVVAGPLANLLLAVLLHAMVYWTGFEEPRSIVASPASGSIAAGAGLVGGEMIEQVQVLGESSKPVRTMSDLRWQLTQAALEGRDVRLRTNQGKEYFLALAQLEAREADAGLMRRIGIDAPFTRPLIGELMTDGVAAQAGLKSGDLVLSVDGQPVTDARWLRERIRASVQEGKGRTMNWKVARAGSELEMQVKPAVVQDGERWIGRIGAYVGGAPELVNSQLGFAEGLWQAGVRTWETSVLSLRMIARMVIGEASLKNLSGPLTIADYAGKSASVGLNPYLLFLALISVSLGVLNLLPLPMLDGGHLMYYLWEAVTGSPPSDLWMERLQRGGIALLVVVMSIALFNDLIRLLG